MNTARSGSSPSPRTSGPPRSCWTWRPKALRRALDVDQAEVVAVEQDQPGAGPEHRPARAGRSRAAAPPAPRARCPCVIVVLSPPGITSAVEPVELLGRAHLARLGAKPRERSRVRLEVALEREHADAAGAGYQPRVLRYQPRCCSRLPSSSCRSRGRPSPRPASREAAATALGVLEVRGRLDDRARARAGVRGLEDPRADEHALGAELHHQRGVGRRRDPAGARSSRPAAGPSRPPRAPARAAPAAPWPRSAARRRPSTPSRRMPARIARMWRTASTTLPVPASPLVRIIAAPSAIRRSASPRLVAPHTNGHLEGPLVDVVRLVGRGQHLGLVDVVHLERLEHLRLDEVADARLGHHRDRHRLLDLADLGRVGHARHAALARGCRRARARAPSPRRRRRPRRSSPARRRRRP